MQRTEIICDICGAYKRETNHWWLGYMENYAKDRWRFILDTFSVSKDPQMDLCSESCASKALSQFMSKIREAQEEQRKQIISEELERDPTLKEHKTNG